MSRQDAERIGIGEGDPVRVSSPRGSLVLPARITTVRDGTAFIPFHYGRRAANELTITAWDPVSKQPQLKFCGIRLDRCAEA